VLPRVAVREIVVSGGVIVQQASRRLVLVGLWACGLLALGAACAAAPPAGSASSAPRPDAAQASSPQLSAGLTAAHLAPSSAVASVALKFAQERNVPISPGPVAIAVGDLNRDGSADLVVADSASATVTVRLGKGNGSFGGPHRFRVAAGSMALAIADVDRDGKPDLITTATAGYGRPVSVCILPGKGDGTFAARHVYRFARDVGAYRMAPLVIGDLNGDHRPDVVTAWGLNVFVLLGRAGGGFAPAHAFPADVHDVNGDGAVTALAVGDLNGDHRKDVVAGGIEGVNTPEGIVSVLLGKGTGGLKAAATGHKGEFLPSGLALADMNHDGRRDLVAGYMVDAMDYGNGGVDYAAVAVSLGNGRGGFAHAAEYGLLSEQDLGGPVIADFNGDGRRDVGLGIGSGIDVMLGNGDGSLQPGVKFGQEQWTGGEMAAVGDFNNDGQPDLAAASSAGTPSAIAVFIDRSRETLARSAPAHR
jgi:FG-GAP-like repeat